MNSWDASGICLGNAEVLLTMTDSAFRAAFDNMLLSSEASCFLFCFKAVFLYYRPRCMEQTAGWTIDFPFGDLNDSKAIGLLRVHRPLASRHSSR